MVERMSKEGEEVDRGRIACEDVYVGMQLVLWGLGGSCLTNPGQQAKEGRNRSTRPARNWYYYGGGRLHIIELQQQGTIKRKFTTQHSD